jgi:hypothetical protein
MLIPLTFAAAFGVDILRTKNLTPEQFAVHVRTGTPIIIEGGDKGLPLEGEVTKTYCWLHLKCFFL